MGRDGRERRRREMVGRQQRDKEKKERGEERQGDGLVHSRDIVWTFRSHNYQSTITPQVYQRSNMYSILGQCFSTFFEPRHIPFVEKFPWHTTS